MHAYTSTMENVSPQTECKQGPCEEGPPGEEAVGNSVDILSPRSIEPASDVFGARSMSMASGR